MATSNTNATVQILAFAGSLRQGSYNKSLIQSAKDLAPTSMEIQIFSLSGIPLYNADVEAEGNPEEVEKFQTAIQKADGVLIATPEYNHGVPAVTKNAIDWASRPSRDAPLAKKPVGILGASPGTTGTARGQSQLSQSLKAINAYTMPQPEILVYRAHQKFDDYGNLTDETTRKYLKKYLNALQEWIRTFN
ncbi:NADPH-dependent FMN reductase [Fodinibius halophilus]|uniref:NAD(P)H-dependent oxidoreductase n=1 Tax=Fodinibius halophilus TaxID=1736908 RepID=A0A6M1T9T1_9BACT|nr:NADPH-dependent FMN reductase [Fodinibius halophilus]NGP89273.1 NAD(P)H-dependent oxidoreductase [Fodinibius halophilus]